MLLRSFEFVLIAYGITLVVALLVAGLIKATYITLDRLAKRGSQTAKPQTVDPPIVESQVAEYRDF